MGFTCPRCAEDVDGAHYGPCAGCRTELIETQFSVPNAYTLRTLGDGIEYKPKTNVTPNQIATKE